MQVSDLLEPLYQPLLSSLLMRPLRSKNVDQQVKTTLSVIINHVFFAIVSSNMLSVFYRLEL